MNNLIDFSTTPIDTKLIKIPEIYLYIKHQILPYYRQSNEIIIIIYNHNISSDAETFIKQRFYKYKLLYIERFNITDTIKKYFSDELTNHAISFIPDNYPEYSAKNALSNKKIIFNVLLLFIILIIILIINNFFYLLIILLNCFILLSIIARFIILIAGIKNKIDQK